MVFSLEHTPASGVLSNPDHVIPDFVAAAFKLGEQAAAVDFFRKCDASIIHECREYVHRADDLFRYKVVFHSRRIDKHRDTDSALPRLAFETPQGTVFRQYVDFGARSSVIADKSDHRIVIQTGTLQLLQNALDTGIDGEQVGVIIIEPFRAVIESVEIFLWSGELQGAVHGIVRKVDHKRFFLGTVDKSDRFPRQFIG